MITDKANKDILKLFSTNTKRSAYADMVLNKKLTNNLPTSLGRRGIFISVYRALRAIIHLFFI